MDVNALLHVKDENGILKDLYPKTKIENIDGLETALAGKGTYSKPSGGIPKTDLASAVQTSLGKADTALQSETYKGTVTSVKVGSTSYNPSSGVVSLPAYPTTLPASDVYAWAKAANKPAYTASEVGAAASSHTHSYAGSSSAGGAATSANKLNVGSSNIGSATQPVYFDSSTGLPVATTYSLAKSVPSDAKFTDTTYSAATQSANGLMSSTDKTKLDGIATGANNYTHPTTSGNKHIPSGGSSGQFLKWSADGTATWAADNNTWTAMVGATSSANGSVGYVNAVPPKDGYNTKYLRADGSWQVPPNTTYSVATQSANGLMSSSDKTKLDGIASGAQVNSITGVKGNSETTYRTGNVNITPANIGLGNVGNFKAVSTVASQGLSDTEKANARTNIGAGTSSFSGSYNDLSNKPTIPTKTSQLTNDSGYTTNTGTVTSVKVGSTSYSPSSGVVSLPAYPTNTDTHRPIQINGTQLLGNNTTPLNLSAGGHVSIEPVSSNPGEARIHLNSWTASIDKRVYLNELTWTQSSTGMYYSSGYFPDFGDYPLRDVLACSVRDFNFLSNNYLLPCIFTLQPGIWFMSDTGTFPSGAYVDVRIVGTLYYEDIRG